MRAREFIFEASYDLMISSMQQKFPDYIEQINWAKTLKKQDRVVWYLNLLKQYIANPQVPGINGQWPEFQEKLLHYLGQEIPQIQAYVFKSQPVNQVFTDLDQLEKSWKEKQSISAPVKIQTGDYKLIPFSDGTAWWFVNRAYCPDEGRSGQHCGNVVGQSKKAQRILSYRDSSGRVILTFILEPKGKLGEMKAKNNQKPQERYHPAIMQLLLNPMVKGISGQGYLADSNFSVFDLSEGNLRIIAEKKSNLITDQIQITPIEILSAPDWIKTDQNYTKFVESPDILNLINDSSHKAWENVLAKDGNMYLIVYAPDDLKNYTDRLLEYLILNNERARSLDVLLRVRNKYRTNPDFLSKLLNAAPGYLQVIPPTTKKYTELCLTAVKTNGYELRHVPEELRTYELCLTSVKTRGLAIESVPKELRTPELCLAAVKNNGYALRHVPEELRTYELCLTAVKTEGLALTYVPEELRTYELCLTAVKNNGYAEGYVPEELRTYELYLTAVKTAGLVIETVPKELRTYELCLTAVKNNSYALRHVPEELHTPELLAASGKSGKN